MRNAMDLTKKHFEQIGDYVQENLPAWAKKLTIVENDLAFQKQSLTLSSELKHQRELMQEGFRQVDKRFEQVDKRFEENQRNINLRFEQVDKRFEENQRNINLRFEQVDKRFEDQLSFIKLGFERVDKKFDRVYDFMKWQIGLGFVMITGIYIKLYLG